MFATWSRLTGLSLIAVVSGCAMCDSCDDYTYPTEGGRWQRVDPIYGRVGSIFTPEAWTRVDDYGDPLLGEIIPGDEEVPAPAETSEEGTGSEEAPTPPATGDEAPTPPEASVLQRPGIRTR